MSENLSAKLAVRHLRLRLGWTRDRLARELNCTPERIFSIEQDQTTPSDSERRCLEKLSMMISNSGQTYTRQALADALRECQSSGKASGKLKEQMDREELEEEALRQFKVDIDR